MQSIKLFLLGASLLIIFSVCQPSSAQECAQSYELAAGEVARCNGVLWPRTWSVEAVTCFSADLPEAQANYDECLKQAKNCEHRFESLNVQCNKTIDDLSTVARDAAAIETPSVWDSKPLLVTLGIAGGFALALMF